MTRIAFDTNVVAYATGLDDVSRHLRAVDLLEDLRHCEFAMPLQVAAELHRLLIRRLGIEHEEASRMVRSWQRHLPIHPEVSPGVFSDALDLSSSHRLQIFDALILAASAQAGCRMLLSEDMQHGFVWRGCKVVNPFAPQVHPLLADLVGR